MFATESMDEVSALTLDEKNNVYVAGWTFGDLRRGRKTHGRQIFVAKVDAKGRKKWLRQFRHQGHSRPLAIALDDTGNIYVSGYINGKEEPRFVGGSGTAILLKLNGSGSKVWEKRLDGVGSLTALRHLPGENALITNRFKERDRGQGYISTLKKFRVDGTELWERAPIRKRNAIATGLTIDSDRNAYISGVIGQVRQEDGKLAKRYFLLSASPTGSPQWIYTSEAGESQYAMGIALSLKGHIYLTGYSYSDLKSADSSVFLAKFDGCGNALWEKKFDTQDVDSSFNISSDNTGASYISGFGGSGLLGAETAGQVDAFLGKFNEKGEKLWFQYLGTEGKDYSYALATDHGGVLYFGGSVQGKLANQEYRGDKDGFVARFNLQGLQF